MRALVFFYRYDRDTAVKQLQKIQGKDGKFPRKTSATAIRGSSINR